MTAPTATRFRILLVALLGLAFVALRLVGGVSTAPEGPDWRRDDRLHVFFHPDCPHCHAALAFLAARPDLEPVLHDVSSPAEEAQLRSVVRDLAIPEDRVGVPLFVRGARHLVGFDTAETSGRAILALAGPSPAQPPLAEAGRRIRLPLVGEVDPTQVSLLALTALMGLSDGFNPCAMWVLIYLVSLVVGLGDRVKIWWLVGSFVLASGVLYYLFMTAWLNAFLLLGHVESLTRLVALAAIGFGIDHLYGLVANQGAVACEVGDAQMHRRTVEQVRGAVAAPIGLAGLGLVIALAFAVNAIEFLCSAALPAAHTQTLALLGLEPLRYYGWIALYVLFFMLDDLIVFGLAAFAARSVADTRYAAWSRAAAGVVLVGLGLWMLAR